MCWACRCSRWGYRWWPGATSRCWWKRPCATPSCNCAESIPTRNSSSATAARWSTTTGAERRAWASSLRATGALAVQGHRVVLYHPALGLGHRLLALFYLGVVELLHLATLEVAAAQDAGLRELCQHPVHRGQANVRALLQQHAKNAFGSHVALAALLEDIQNLQARQRGLQARAFEFVDIGHGMLFRVRAGTVFQAGA